MEDELDLAIYALIEIRDTRLRTGKVHKWGLLQTARQLEQLAGTYVLRTAA